MTSIGDSGCILAFLFCLSCVTHLTLCYTVLRVMYVSTKPLSEKLDSLLPIALTILYFLVIFLTCSIAWTTPGIALLITGTYFCLCSVKIIVSTITRQTFCTFEDMGLHAPYLISLVLLPLHSSWSKSKSAEQKRIGEVFLLSLILVANLFVFLFYVLNVIRQITGYLGIDCFSIRK